VVEVLDGADELDSTTAELEDDAALVEDEDGVAVEDLVLVDLTA